ncbi:MAG: magnesium transporter [Actinobacteria bacterium]|nr:magnesium transporter [Actinomycetota bacterium]
MEERIRVIAETLQDMIIRGDISQAVTTASELHSADLAEALKHIDLDDRIEILINMEPRNAAMALLELEDPDQVEIAGRLRTGELYELLVNMPVDEAVDLLGDITFEQRIRLFGLFGREEAGEFRELLRYPDDTAGGLMTPDFLSVHPYDTVGEVIEMIRSAPEDVETIYYIYVLSEDGVLRNVLSLRELIVSQKEKKVGEMAPRKVIAVEPDDDQELVAELISKYDLLAVPVMDASGRMLGLVTVDDVMDVIGEEVEEDIMRLAGATTAEEDTRPGLVSDISRRLPWFFLAAALEILIAGGILKMYSDVLSEFIILVFFIPLLVLMGGNIAIQSSTIIGHRLSDGSFSRSVIKAVFKEMLWGVIIGVLTGVAVGLIAFLLDQDVRVGFVVGFSLTFTVIAASMIGCAFPAVMRLAGRDPGGLPGPLVGTTMDMVSLGIYLGVGLLLIK